MMMIAANAFDLDTLARTLYGEARGASRECQEHIAHVVLNRASHTGQSIRAVCLAPMQFSCWNRLDPNRAKLMAVRAGDRVFDACYAVAKAVVEDVAGDDPTKGSTHYCTLVSEPSWAKGHVPVLVDAAHKFFNDVR